MNLTNLDQDDLLSRCSWCHRVLDPDKECFGAGSRVWPAAKPLIRKQEGKLFPLALSGGRQIIAIVPTADSPARAHGHDIYFQACSEKCCAELTAALKAELPGNN